MGKKDGRAKALLEVDGWAAWAILPRGTDIVTFCGFQSLGGVLAPGLGAGSINSIDIMRLWNLPKVCVRHCGLAWQPAYGPSAGLRTF